MHIFIGAWLAIGVLLSLFLTAVCSFWAKWGGRGLRRKLLLGLAVIPLLVCGLAHGDEAALELNPWLEEFVASYLVYRDRPMRERILGLTDYFGGIENSLRLPKSIYVKDFDEYLRQRNRRFETPRESLTYLNNHQLVSPLNIQTGDSLTMEKILDYEADQAQRVLDLSEIELPGAMEGVLGSSARLWKELPGLYRIGSTFRDELTERSSQLADGLLDGGRSAISEGIQRGGLGGAVWAGMGVFAMLNGVAVKAAQEVGRTVVNPGVRTVVIGKIALPKLHDRVLAEIERLRLATPSEKEKILLRLDQQISQRLLTDGAALAHPLLASAPGDLKNVIEQKFLPEAIEAVSNSRSYQALWTVLTTSGFEKLSVQQQFRIMVSGLGPLFPQVLHMLSKHHLLNNTALKHFLCCDPPADRKPGDTVELNDGVIENLSTIGFRLKSPSATILAVRPLKETFQVQALDHQNGEVQIVAEILNPKALEGWEDDVRLLRKLAANIELMKAFESAGVPHMAKAIKALETMVREELDVQRTATMQRRAGEAFNQNTKARISGRKLAVEIYVPRVLYASDKILVQESVSGMSLAEARAQDPDAVQAALEVFGQRFLKAALGSEGLIWAEPIESNVLVEFDGAGKIRLNLVNFGSMSPVAPEAIGALFKSFGDLPFSTLRNANHWADGDLESNLQTFRQLTEAGIEANPVNFRLGQGMLNLRRLVGADGFQSLLVRAPVRNPRLAFLLLPKIAAGQVSQFFGRLRTSTPQNSCPFYLEHGFAH